MDNVLLSSITKNGANYDIASVEVTKAALQKALTTEVETSPDLLNVDELSKSYTSQMCRARWGFLTLMVSTRCSLLLKIVTLCSGKRVGR